MNKFSLSKFIEVSSKLCIDACYLVNKTHKSQNLKKFMKGFNDPVTQADFKVQTLLIHGFKQNFPCIPIIGEENLESQYNFQIQKEQISMQDNGNHQLSLPKNIFSNNAQIPLQQEILQADYANGPCLWIDPLDCTRGFINGYAEDVTILIGMSLGKKSRIGLIGTPFKRTIQGQLVFNPSVTIGCVDMKQAYIYAPNELNQWKKLDNPYLNSSHRRKQFRKVASSVLKISSRQKSIINSLGAQTIRVGGSGRKINLVANKAADIMLFIDSYTGKWDSCAGEAVIKALGGSFTNSYGGDLQYNHELVEIYGKKKALNKKGMICSLDKQIHRQAIDLIDKYDKQEQKVSRKYGSGGDLTNHIWENIPKLVISQTA